MNDKEWRIYGGSKSLQELPEAPPWRRFREGQGTLTHAKYEVEERQIDLVNAALYLRRPLLITGPPGTGKSTLAHAVARDLKLDDVLVWRITSRSNLKDALYRYDALERLRQTREAEHLHSSVAANKTARESERKAQLQVDEVSKYFRLGPLGTAFSDSKQHRPRVLLIDEIDKSDLDLPNDLLHIFEEGYFEIPELARLNLDKPVRIWSHKREKQIPIQNGEVVCEEFPLVIITSNGERDLPGPFLRRCLSMEIAAPNPHKLMQIVQNHLESLDDETLNKLKDMAEEIAERRQRDGDHVATDQLLNAAYLTQSGFDLESKMGTDMHTLRAFILRTISRLNI